MSVARTVAKNTTFNLIANASDQFITFGIGVLIARYLGPADYDVYAFLVWFLLLGYYIVNLGLGNMVIRYIAEAVGTHNTSNARNYARLAISLRITAAIILTLVVLIFSGFWSKVFGYPEYRYLFILVSFGLLPSVLNFLLSSIFSGFQKYEYSAYITLVMHPARAIGVIIVVVMNSGIQEILIVNIISWVIGVFVGIFFLRRLIPLKEVFSLPQMNPDLKRAIKYSLVMTGVLLVNYIVLQRSQVFFLGIYNIENAVGFFTIAFLIPNTTVGILLIVFSQVLIPAVSEQFGRGDTVRIRQLYLTSARFLMFIGFPLAIGGIVLSEPIIVLLYGADYLPVIPLMQIMFIPFAITGISHAAVSVIYGIDQASFMLKFGLVLVVISVGLCVWLIPSYGATGAAISVSIPRLIAPIVYIRYASKKCQTTWPFKDTLRIIFASLLMGAAVYGIFTSLESPLIIIIVGIPLGIVVHIISLLLFGAINSDDIRILQRAQENLPAFLQKYSGKLIGSMRYLVQWRSRIIKSAA